MASEHRHDLNLLYVHVIHRHGERTPVKKRLERAGIPTVWNLCSASHSFYAAVLATDGAPAPYERFVQAEERNRVKTYKDKEACLSGELTNRGRKTTAALGQRLRKEYAERLGFLSTLYDPNALYLRSSNMSRTVASLQEVFNGLYPTGTRGSIVPVIVIRDLIEENLFPNTMACKRLRKLNAEFSETAARLLNPQLRDLEAKLTKYVDEVKIDGHPRLSGILDTIKAAKHNGIPLPPEFDDDVMQRIEDAVVYEWFHGYFISDEYKRLACGRLATDIKDIFMKKAGNDSSVASLKMSIYSAHDTSLATLLIGLGWFNWKWPPFTSNIVFELYQEKHESGITSWFFPFMSKPKTYVRTKYNDKPIVLEHCKSPGNHMRQEGGKSDETMCTLEAFTSIVEKLRIHDWEKECGND